MRRQFALQLVLVSRLFHFQDTRAVVGEMKKLSALCKTSSPQSAAALEGTAPEFVIAVKKVCGQSFCVSNPPAASGGQGKRFGAGHRQLAHGDQYCLPENHSAREGSSIVALHDSFAAAHASCPARVLYLCVTYHTIDSSYCSSQTSFSGYYQF